MDLLTIAIIAVVGIVVLFIIGKFLSGCLLRLVLFAVIIGVIAFLVWRFLLA